MNCLSQERGPQNENNDHDMSQVFFGPHARDLRKIQKIEQPDGTPKVSKLKTGDPCQ